MWRLRRFLRLVVIFWRICGRSTGHSHFLHALPLFGSNHHYRFRLKRVVGHRAAHHDVIAGLNIRHGDAVAAFSQGGLFIQLDGLRHIVWAENLQLGSIHGLHLAEDVVLAKYARWPPAAGSTTRFAACTLPPPAATRAAANPAVGASPNHFRSPG